MEPREGQNQEDWVERLGGPDPERSQAIQELRDLLIRALTRSLSTRYGTSLPVEDVVQEALLRILDSMSTFEGRSRFTTWAITIATRIGISELRRRHYRDKSLDSMTGGDSLTLLIPDDRSPSVEGQLDQQLLLKTLQQLIASDLTEKQRAATQGFLDGLTVEEIARRTGSNRNAVYKLIHDARTRLRNGMINAGQAPEDLQLNPV